MLSFSGSGAVVLNSGVIDFAYKGPFGNVCHFWQSPLRGAAPGMQLVEARDVANVLRCTAPTTKHYPAPNVRSATVEQLCYRVTQIINSALPQGPCVADHGPSPGEASIKPAKLVLCF